MPHVDQGMLHAYLDGALDALLEAGALPPGTTRSSIEAHLAACADCRALLEAERTIRTRAGAILDAVAPIVDVPPFSELFGDQRARPRRRGWPLAWAASVLLAAGAGWWGSQLVQTRSSEPDPAARAASESDRALTDMDARDGGAGAAAAPSLPAPPEVQSAVAGVTENVGDEQRERAQSLDDSSGRRLADRRADQPTAAAAAAAGLARSEAVRPGAARDSVQRLQNPLGIIVDTVAVGRAAMAAAPPPVAAPPPPAADRQRVAPGEFAAFRDPADAGRVEQFRQHLAELDAGRIPLTADPLPAELPLLQIAGGSPPSVQRGTALGGSLARITQRAPNGVAVELIVWRQASIALDQIVVTGRTGADSAAARALRQRAEAEVVQKQQVERAPFAYSVVTAGERSDGRNEVLLRSSDDAVFVALRARMPAAELRALADRLIEVRRD